MPKEQSDLINVDDGEPEKSGRGVVSFILEECVRTSGSELGFLGFVNEDETVLEVELFSEHVMNACAMENKPVEFPIVDAGLWAEAIRRRRPVIVNDYRRPDPRKKGYPEGHVALERLQSIPIIKKDRVVALVTVANKKRDYIQSDLRRLSLFLEAAWGIVQQEKTEKSLRESEERFRIVADFSYNWKVWKDAAGRYDYISPAVERITGYKVEEFMNDQELVVKIAHPDDRAHYIEHRKVYSYDIVHNFDYRIIARNGEERWINHLCRPVFGADGRFLGRRASNRNITRIKRLEQELEAHSLQLEFLVNERTAELRAANELLRREIERCNEGERLLLKSQKETEEKSRGLEEMNTALKVFLKQRGEDRKELEDRVLLSVKRILMPHLTALDNSGLDDEVKMRISAVKAGLKEITSPFLRRLSAHYPDLTPKEIQVAHLIRDGKSTKEIVRLMNVSPAAVNLHRNHLRKKLGLNYKKTNLNIFLSSLA